MLYFSILVPLPAECSESVPSCHCIICIYLYKKLSVSQLPTLILTLYQFIKKKSMHFSGNCYLSETMIVYAGNLLYCYKESEEYHA